MRVRSLATLTIVSAVGAGSFIGGVPAAVAAGQASITLATPQLVEYLNDDGKGDGRADDLNIAYTEQGSGNSKGATVELSVTRTVSVTCVSAVSEFSYTESEPLTWFDGEDPSGATTNDQTNEQKPGNWFLEGNFMVLTSFDEVCPRSDPDPTGEAYFVKDYSVTYTDVVVKDSENGVEASDPGPYRFQAAPSAGFTTPDAELAGVQCTIYDLESGECHSD